MNDDEKIKAAEEWHSPLSCRKKKLKNVLSTLGPFKLQQSDVPLMIRLIENPDFNFLNLFPGRVSLSNHDCIHVILGRGLLPKDEAFVIGYTMGSTKKMTKFKKWLFLFFVKHLYPKTYSFTNEEVETYNYGLIAGTKCPTDLSKANFRWWGGWTIHDIRRKLGVDTNFLKIIYRLEKNKYLNSKESQRLLD